MLLQTVMTVKTTGYKIRKHDQVAIQNFIICLVGKDTGMIYSVIARSSQCISTSFLALMTKPLERGDRSLMVKARTILTLT